MSALENLLYSQFLAPAIVAALTWLGSILWSKLSTKQQDAITSAMGAVQSALRNIAYSLPKGMTAANAQSVLVGTADSELKSLGLDPTNPILSGLVSKAVSEALGLFMAANPLPDNGRHTVATLPQTANLLAKK